MHFPYRLTHFSSLALSLHFVDVHDAACPLCEFAERIYSLCILLKAEQKLPVIFSLFQHLCANCYKLHAVSCLVL